MRSGGNCRVSQEMLSKMHHNYSSFSGFPSLLEGALVRHCHQVFHSTYFAFSCSPVSVSSLGVKAFGVLGVAVTRERDQPKGSTLSLLEGVVKLRGRWACALGVGILISSLSLQC